MKFNFKYILLDVYEVCRGFFDDIKNRNRYIFPEEEFLNMRSPYVFWGKEPGYEKLYQGVLRC